MAEVDVVARTTQGPVTKAWLLRDLAALGVKPGMLLMAHTSLSGLGWVVGGAATVAQALLEAVGSEGTLLMPTFTSWNTNPANWRNPAVPKAWYQLIRDEMPAYDPRASQGSGMGLVSEYFRCMSGVLRSAHPACSWAAIGPRANKLLDNHAPDMALGLDSPVGRCYLSGGHVLSLATERTTCLHLAEHLCEYPGKKNFTYGSAMLVDGQRQWVASNEVAGDDDDFEQLRLAYIAAGNPHCEAQVAYGTARLFPVRELVDYAVLWLPANRKAATQHGDVVD